MKHSTASAAAIRARAAELGEARSMRRGSLTERWVRCSKPSCACKENPEARHGPYYSLTRVVDGVTRTRLVTADQATVVRRQIEVGREFRDAAEVYWQACEQAADAELEAVAKDSAAEAEKGGSGKRSRRRSSPRSRR
jgi:hypothetical protein